MPPTWKAEKRRQREAEYKAEYEARCREEAHRALLTLYERIDEIKDVADVKEFLHVLVERLGLDG